MVFPATNFKAAAARLRRATGAAFALVEVILAIGIATGLLLVALVFYHQAADLRGQVLIESDKFSEMRLTLDRIAGDLRTALPHGKAGRGFAGDETSMWFTRVIMNAPDLTQPGAGQKTDLARITLMTMMETNGDKLTITGLSRTEEPYLAPGASPGGSVSIFSDSSTSSQAGTNIAAETLSENVRFVRFRYWNGVAWQAGWTNDSPPPGVEIVLADEPLPPEAAPEDYPPNPFRRVVFLPGGSAPRRSEQDPVETPLTP